MRGDYSEVNPGRRLAGTGALAVAWMLAGCAVWQQNGAPAPAP